MGTSIDVHDLGVRFRTATKAPGLRGALRSLFRRTYQETWAVADVSFAIQSGELVGFIGPNGAGKTSTLKMLSGLLAPSTGSVRVLGFEPFQREPDFLRHISLVMGQKNQLIWDLPAVDSFLLNKAIYAIPQHDYDERFHALVELLQVSDQLQTPVRKLSLGQRMKMELIAALLHTPKVLYLDEPTIGLDVMVQQHLRDFIRDYNRRYEATILLTSHYMGDVKALCERVLLIAHGRLVFDGKLDTLMAEHSRDTRITAVLEKRPSPRALAEIGDVVSYTYPHITLTVPRAEASKRAARLIQQCAVADITLEETPIEDIIRDLFHSL